MVAAYAVRSGIAIIQLSNFKVTGPDIKIPLPSALYPAYWSMNAAAWPAVTDDGHTAGKGSIWDQDPNTDPAAGGDIMNRRLEVKVPQGSAAPSVSITAMWFVA